jgi:6-oxocyclohex-1-ene-carbonyl-CoA hydrolase
MNFKTHDLCASETSGKVRYQEVALRGPDGTEIEGLHSIWISLDNPGQMNSYTTDMVKDVILAFRRASNDRSAVAVVFTGTGSRAFCTGGNTAEYAGYYAGRPAEYMQYMRLFNDMVTSILTCDLPVICRVNGMRIAGGQEIGMACDFSIASDLATFGQAGPKHGSAPDGGSTDFLPLFVGIEQAMASCTLCEPWSAYKALRLGLVTEVVPVLEVGGRIIPNPLVITDTWLDGQGRIVLGEPSSGEALERGRRLLKEGRIVLDRLDQAVNSLILKLARTMPGCLSKTLCSVRKHKLEHWDRNRETNRAWLSLNMMTEGKAGFRAFHEAVGPDREVDFLKLRRALAAGEVWSEALIESVLPAARKSVEIS